MHKSQMTNLVETPNMADFDEKTKNYKLSNDLLQQVMRLAL
jgi:hypothetical protein